LILLQTLPGLHFRSRWDHQDEKSGVTYFRNLVEAHAANILDVNSVRDAIGLEAEYTPLFEHSLRVIPSDQLGIGDIDWDNPLGRGDNGAVYAATWTRPPGVLTTTWSGQKQIVLKEVRPREGEGRDTLRKFMKEASSKTGS
jgi:hypothetical protein